MVVKIEHPPANGSYAAATEGPAAAARGGLIDVRCTMEGIRPLLMNAMSEAELLAIRDKVKAPKSAAKPRPREEAERKLHRLADGSPHVPLRAFMAALINAGQFIRLDGKRQISTADKTILPGMLTVLDRSLPIVNQAGLPATWEVDIMQGRNPNGGEAVCIIRPRIDDWRFTATLQIDQQQMPLGMARELVDTAGKRIGLLDFRPQRKGTFGQFVVTRWEVIVPEDKH